MRLSLFTAFLLFCAHSSHCARILAYFPTPSISHQVVFHALIKDLAARGHQLTVLTTDLIILDNPNVTQIDLHSSYEVFRREFNFVDFKKSGTDEIEIMDIVFPIMLKFLEEQFSHPEVKKLIANNDKKDFDLMIIEHLGYTPILGFAEIYNCPVIGITSLDTMNENYERLGNPANPVLHPEMFFPFTQGAMTFEERWRALKYYVKQNYFSRKRNDIELRKLVIRHFPNVTTDFDTLKRRVEFVMVNTHPALGYIRPLVPNTIQLGFMHIEEPKPLKDGELKTFLDNSEHGVIYMSLGSNVQSKELGPEIIGMLLKVFGSLKYDVLWKFESDHLPNKPKTVMIQKWLPQADLLAHHKIKLFITQGGQQSMEETIDRGVPTVVIPFVADQHSNAKIMEQ
jgi:glucuronosyltransferase